jgi:hypothetical protein
VNKWQIICPVAAMLLYVMVARVVAQRRMRQGIITTQSFAIGHDLITATNSSHLVRVSPFLTAQLSKLLGAPTQVATVLSGDEPRADGMACSRLVLTNAAGQRLLIRLREAGGQGMFEVVGFSTGRP